jgi:acyl-CoA synthetase (AMP-forming)/AMP-acid ligase II
MSHSGVVAIDVTGEAVHAFVVAVTGCTPDPERLRATVLGSVGAAAVPQTVRVIDQVPVAASGKPDKKAPPMDFGTPLWEDPRD